MRSADEILAALKIVRPSWTPLDTFRTMCPKCSGLRSSGKRRRKPVLRVVIARTQISWRCSHCGWLGVARLDERISAPEDKEAITEAPA